ncbi:VTT domain-containing protein [Candidatus Micrarchaeota archaeon]|nr:VTT domain-containing protein [Candidatus Micrarchaeota archaeon]
MKMSKFWKGTYIIVLSLVLIILLYNLRERVEQFKNFGYFGVFVISLISSGTVLLPAPGWVAVIGLATSLNPLILGLVAGVGSSLGELTSYFLGLGGRFITDKKFDWLQNLMKKHGMKILFVLALIPNPIFDVGGIIAGASKMKIHNFLIPVLCGKIIRFIAVAYVASIGWKFLIN